jgi:hypothetical protein
MGDELWKKTVIDAPPGGCVRSMSTMSTATYISALVSLKEAVIQSSVPVRLAPLASVFALSHNGTSWYHLH